MSAREYETPLQGGMQRKGHDMQEKAKAAVLASLTADSLALGAHWIYDTASIVERFGRVDRLLAPAPDSPHAERRAGEFTHYGDQTMVLLESVAAKGAFDLSDFAERWHELFADYPGYLDEASRSTLAALAAGKSPEGSGSASGDLAGAARIAPLAYRYRDDLDGLLTSTRLQTRMTHRLPAVTAAAEFFARAAFLILHGEAPTRAMRRAAREDYDDVPVADWVADGLAHAAMDTVAAIGQFGQSCHVEGAFRSVVQCVAKYEDDLETALVENVMAGGDSAARGMLIGLLLGAHLGLGAVPVRWLESLKARCRIEDLLAKID